MKFFTRFPGSVQIAATLFHWTLIVVPLSFITGSLVALFLWLLELATHFRWSHLQIIFLLPVAGVGIHFLYRVIGKNSASGNNLIISEIHNPGEGIPLRMGPLVLVSTIITHLFGGSAGREGTAVQIGGSIAAWLTKWLRLDKAQRSTLLMCGMAAGFGAVFGTPVTGAIFAVEVLSIGKIKYHSLLPCFIASLLADVTCSAYGIHHTAYHIGFRSTNLSIPFIHFDLWLLVKVIVCSIAFGLASRLFAVTAHFIKKQSAALVTTTWLVPVIGAAAVIAISYALGTFDYLGLGVKSEENGISIVSAFEPGGAAYLSWFWKLLLTAITLSTGFKGGEVTPLFFIGATLGNTLAVVTNSPVDLFAGLGFIAVFAGATNTPLACTLMGVELFGAAHSVFYAVACFTAYYFSGHAGIYQTQQVAISKDTLHDGQEQIVNEL